MVKCNHYCLIKVTNTVTLDGATPVPTPLYRPTPSPHHSLALDLTEVTWQAAWAPIWGPEAGHYFYLIALLTAGGGLWLTARVAGPCRRAGFITTGIIAFMQAWNDTARRASSLPYEPQAQTWSQKATSFSLQGGSLAHLCGFFVCFSGIGTKSNTGSCIKLCVHTCAGETEGG